MKKNYQILLKGVVTWKSFEDQCNIFCQISTQAVRRTIATVAVSDFEKIYNKFFLVWKRYSSLLLLYELVHYKNNNDDSIFYLIFYWDFIDANWCQAL